MTRLVDDEVLLALDKKSGGGSGGTSNYNSLDNKPSINGITLQGNKTASQLKLSDVDVRVEDGKLIITHLTD